AAAGRGRLPSRRETGAPGPPPPPPPRGRWTTAQEPTPLRRSSPAAGWWNGRWPGSPATAAAPATTSYPDVGVIRIIRRPWLSRADAVLHGVGTFWTRVARDNSALLPRHDRWAPVCRW